MLMYLNKVTALVSRHPCIATKFMKSDFVAFVTDIILIILQFGSGLWRLQAVDIFLRGRNHYRPFWAGASFK